MKNVLKQSFLVMILSFAALVQTNAQTSFSFCGSTFEVQCDGTVDVDLASTVMIYKIYDGSDLIVRLNNYTDPGSVPTVPFNSGAFGFIQTQENYFLYINDSSCGNFTKNISQILGDNCAGYAYP